MLDKITPVLLTLNEAPNIGRVLDKLTWANDIVIADSGSTDDTLAIIRNFQQARCFNRKFDTHAGQWNFALHETGIKTEWVLALDADYVLTDELLRELKQLRPEPATQGYQAQFMYCIQGRPLRGSLYPPVTVLYRKENARYEQDGHTQRINITNNVEQLHGGIFHDDRKPLRHWLQSQQRYMTLESKKIYATSWNQLSSADKIRKCRIIAPFAVLIYCLFIRGVVLDGWPGWYYALQRMLAEVILSVQLLRRDAGLHTDKTERSL